MAKSLHFLPDYSKIQVVDSEYPNDTEEFNCEMSSSLYSQFPSSTKEYFIYDDDTEEETSEDTLYYTLPILFFMNKVERGFIIIGRWNRKEIFASINQTIIDTKTTLDRG